MRNRAYIQDPLDAWERTRRAQDRKRRLRLLALSVAAVALTGLLIWAGVEQARREQAERDYCRRTGGSWDVTGWHLETYYWTVHGALVPQQRVVQDYGCVRTPGEPFYRPTP